MAMLQDLDGACRVVGFDLIIKVNFMAIGYSLPYCRLKLATLGLCYCR